MIRLALVLMLLASRALGAEVVIQAGEHDGFTRLALHVGSAGWRFGRVDGGYGLHVDDHPDFRHDAVHDTITRDRIAAVHAVADRIDLTIGCDCRARVFPYGEGWLVIDIVDGAPDASSPHEAWLEPRPPARPAARPTPPVIDRGVLPLLFTRTLPGLTQAAPSAAPPAPAAEESAAAGAASRANVAPADPPGAGSRSSAIAATDAARVTGAAQTMAEGMVRAADLGLLDLAVPRDELDAAPGLPAAPEITPAPTAPSPAATRPPEPGITAQTSMDGALAIPGQSRRAGCLDDSLFDFGSWAGGGDFFAEIGPLRAALTDADGHPAADRVEALARLYLAYGFGREAAETLSLTPRPGHEREVMQLLARIIDGRPADLTLFDTQAGCGGPVLLWHALAQDTLAHLDEVQRIEVVTTARRLPDALLTQIAPRLALLFAESGDALAADELLARDATTTDRATTLRTGIEIARASGDSDATGERVTQAVHGDARAGPQALVDMVDFTIANDRQPDPGDLDLLAAAVFEYRGQPEEAALLDARIRLLSHVGDHRAALALVPSLPQPDRTTTLARALETFAQEADDGTFIELAFDDRIHPPDERRANILAARLLALGFPERALEIMRGTDPGDQLTQRRYLRAEAAAALGRADLVEAELLGLVDSRAESIRAGITPATPAAATARAPSPPARPEELAGPLARSHALIEEAEDTRNRARDLLDQIATRLMP